MNGYLKRMAKKEVRGSKPHISHDTIELQRTLPILGSITKFTLLILPWTDD